VDGRGAKDGEDSQRRPFLEPLQPTHPESFAFVESLFFSSLANLFLLGTHTLFKSYFSSRRLLICLTRPARPKRFCVFFKSGELACTLFGTRPLLSPRKVFLATLTYSKPPYGLQSFKHTMQCFPIGEVDKVQQAVTLIREPSSSELQLQFK